MVSIDMDMPASCSKCKMYESGGYNQLLEPYDGAHLKKIRYYKL